MYLIDDTFYKETLDEYNESRPACLIIVIDSYDELFDDMKDSEQAKELESINSLLEEYIGHSTGFLRRVSNSRYIAVVEERDVRWMLEGRFDILDRVRALHPGGLTTLSIGVGHGGKTLQECHQMARESIDIASVAAVIRRLSKRWMALNFTAAFPTAWRNAAMSAAAS